MKVRTCRESLGLRIPKDFATELGICPSSEMEINMEAGALLARSASTIEFNALLAEITVESQRVGKRLRRGEWGGGAVKAP